MLHAAAARPTDRSTSPFIKKMMSEKKSWRNNNDVTPEQMIRKYFGGFCTKPSHMEIALLMDNVRTLEIQPQIHALENRKSIDPCYVVKRAEQEEMDLFKLGEELYEENDIVKDLYPSKEKYIMELCRTKLYKDKGVVLGMKVEEVPETLIPFDRTPYYDLDKLVQEVEDMMFGGSYEGISSVEWTDAAYRTYYGIHYGLDHYIKINSVLNSKDVPKEVVKFVIYHELLHRDNMSHDNAFRAEEQKYPNYAECEHFLYDNMHHFDIMEW